jgi:hypothetical protein
MSGTFVSVVGGNRAVDDAACRTWLYLPSSSNMKVDWWTHAHQADRTLMLARHEIINDGE